MGLVRHLSDFYIERLSAPRPRFYESEEFQAALDDLLDRCARQVAEHHSSAGDKYDFNNRHDVLNSMKASPHYQTFRNRLVTNHQDLKKNYDELFDQKKQANWANSVDHLKNYLFKTIAGITIAAIILGTAIVANDLDISIPLLRF